LKMAIICKIIINICILLFTMDQVHKTLIYSDEKFKADTQEVTEIYKKHLPSYKSIWVNLDFSIRNDGLMYTTHWLTSFFPYGNDKMVANYGFDSHQKEKILQDLLLKKETNDLIKNISNEDVFRRVLTPRTRCDIIANELNKAYASSYKRHANYPVFFCEDNNMAMSEVEDSITLAARIKK
jgi:hypothetical protein